MGYYLPCTRNQKASASQTVTFHNVEIQLYEGMVFPSVPVAKGLASRLHVANLKRYESHLARSVDVAFTYSERDRDIYQGLYPHGRWQATKNGANVALITPTPQPLASSVLLVGTLNYPPNRRGLLWFLDEVLPLLNPEIRFTVAGSGADADLQARLAAANVRFVNRPDSLQPFYDENALAIAPIFEGSGTRTKILEALAYERVTITTTKGVEGLFLAEGEGIAIADTPAAFADAIHRLSPPEVRSPIAHAGRQAVLERYDWSVVAAEMIQVWQGLHSPGNETS
jgi:glycosyltransferase involved in cell wall biosynthesis